MPRLFCFGIFLSTQFDAQTKNVTRSNPRRAPRKNVSGKRSAQGVFGQAVRVKKMKIFSDKKLANDVHCKRAREIKLYSQASIFDDRKRKSEFDLS